MCPARADSAPVSATSAYTTALTNRVAGLVMEEKNVARMEQVLSRALISSKRSVSAASRP